MNIRATALYIIAMLVAGATAGPAAAGDSGCQPGMEWGFAYEHAKRAQIQHPDAGKTVRPVSIFDGTAAELAVAGYRADFGKEKAPQNYNINLGDISGVGQK